MCGIAAILLQPQQRTQSEWEGIREIFTRNLVFNEERGKDATGCAVIQQGGQVSMLKMPVNATTFVEEPGYKSLLKDICEKTALILGHTRQPTKGNPSQLENNHPVQAGPVFGVHNGHIANDDELFERYGYRREAQVDSEIVFRLLEDITPELSVDSYLSAARPLLQLMEGQFTFLACDQRSPTRLLVLKHFNPLCLHFQRELNTLIFSSRYIFLRKTFGHSVSTEALVHDQLMIFDATMLDQLGTLPASTLSFCG